MIKSTLYSALRSASAWSILSILSILSNSARAALPPLYGDLRITNVIEQVAGTSYTLQGTYTDRTIRGYTVADIAVGDMISTEDSQGYVDPWLITNILAASGSALSAQVQHAGAGASNAPMSGVMAIVCAVSSNIPLPPDAANAAISEYLALGARNYALQLLALRESGSGGITDAPSDGKLYGRQDAAWVEVPTSAPSADASTWPAYPQTQLVHRVGGFGTAWQASVSLPAVRYGGSAITYSNNVFFAGGYSAGAFTSNAFCFDGTAWTEIEAMPAARYHSGMALLQTNIFVMGGYAPGPALTSNVFAYVGTNWIEVAPMPKARAYFGAATLGSYVYAVGGFGTSGLYSTNTFRFDGTTWDEVKGMPAAKVHHAVVTMGDDIYAIGGHNSYIICTNVFKFDGTDWTEVAGLPSAMQTHAAAVLSSKIYVIGGISDTDPVTNVFVFDGDTWTEGAGLAVACARSAAATLNDRIYNISGMNAAGTDAVADMNVFPGTTTNTFGFDSTGTWSIRHDTGAIVTATSTGVDLSVPITAPNLGTASAQDTEDFAAADHDHDYTAITNPPWLTSMTLGTGPTDAYPGDVGHSVSGRADQAYTASTQAQAAAAAALPKTFTNAAEVTTLKITGGTPAVGQLWVVTNANGSGTLALPKTKMVYSYHQSTNTANLVITGVGFRPVGCTVFAVHDGGVYHSNGVVDYNGSESCVFYYLSATWARSAHAWEIRDGANKASHGDWVSWDADGATFSRTPDAGVANVLIKLTFLFYRY